MTNNYYDASVKVARASQSRTSEENASREAIAAGFDKLPEPEDLQYNMLAYAATTGSSNTYAMTLSSPATSYVTGMGVRAQINHTNTGAATLNVDSLGARSIKRYDGSDVEASDLTQGDIHEFIYDGTYFCLVSPSRTHLNASVLASGNLPVAVSPRAFGATTDGTDVSTELQAWLDYLQDNPEKIGMLDGRYSIGTGLVATRPVKIVGSTWGDQTSSASQPPTPACALIALTADMDMLTFKSDTAGERLWNVVIDGIYFDGDNKAGQLLILSGCFAADISAAGERCRGVALDFSDINGISGGAHAAFNKIRFWRYNSGSSGLCRQSIGLKIDGTTSSGGTQFELHQAICATHEYDIDTITNSGGDALITFDGDHDFEAGDPVIVYNTGLHDQTWSTVATVPDTDQITVTGLSYAGADSGGFAAPCVSFWLGDTDSGVFHKMQGSSIYMAGDRTGEATPRRAFRKNKVGLSSANIILEPGALNDCGLINSENATLTVLGDATLGGMLIDRNNGKMYEFEQYRFTDEIIAGTSGALVSTATIGGTGAFGAPAIILPDASTSSAAWSLPVPRTWDEGDLISARVVYGASGTSGAFRCQITASPRAIGQGVSGGDTTAFTLAVPGSSTNLTEQIVTLNTTFSEGDTLLLKFERLGADGLDTSTHALHLYSVTLSYKADGPVEASKRFNAPAMST